MEHRNLKFIKYNYYKVLVESEYDSKLPFGPYFVKMKLIGIFFFFLKSG